MGMNQISNCSEFLFEHRIDRTRHCRSHSQFPWIQWLEAKTSKAFVPGHWRRAGALVGSDDLANVPSASSPAEGAVEPITSQNMTVSSPSLGRVLRLRLASS